jgi:hypothetical protein
MMTSDLFTDSAILRTRVQTGANGLGEPVYAETTRPLKGLLVRRSKQFWTDLGLVGGVETVFLTSEAITDLPAAAVLEAGGTTYRRVTVARRNDLWGDEGVTRLLLQEGP